MKNLQKGFTLIELLVVIAIIGLLSSIVFSSLTGARAKGRIAAAQGSMRNILTAAILCTDDGGTVAGPTATINGGGTAVCSDTTITPTVYGALPTGWTYTAGAFPANPLKASGDKTITCTESGCITS